MIVKTQKPILFKNKCNAIFDSKHLESAIIWAKSEKPVCQTKHVFIHGVYPAVSIHGRKIHIHRLLMSWWYKRKLKTNEYVHHIDHNRLNSKISNLEIQTPSEHQSYHTRGRKLSEDHRRKISLAGHRRKGMKLKKSRSDVKSDQVLKLINDGFSINKISKIFKCDWSTVKLRIHQNPDLLSK